MATCAISGDIPEEPVVSIKTGHIFEKRLIMKHLSIHSTCPITNQPLSESDLLTIQTVNPITRPRPPTASSFPALLNLLQNEYDSILLETFTLRQQLEQTRTDLAKALYQQDASNRVIARLYQENEQLKAKFNDIDANIIAKAASLIPSTSSAVEIHHTTQSTSMDDSDESVITTDTTYIANLVTATTDRLGGANRRPATKQRTKQSKSIVDYAQFTLLTDIHYPTTELTTLDTQYDLSMIMSLSTTTATTANGLLTFIGTESGHVVVVQNSPSASSSSSSRVVTSIPIGNTPITAIATTHDYHKFPWNPSGDDAAHKSSLEGMYTFSVGLGAQQRIVKTYTCPNTEIDNMSAWVCLFSSIQHGGSIKSIHYHPSNSMILSTCTDSYLRGFDPSKGGQCVLSYKLPTNDIQSLCIHPDGRLVAINTIGKSIFIDLFTGTPSLELIEPQERQHLPIHGITFGQNGYSAITYSINNGYTLWDLRHVKPDNPSSGLLSYHNEPTIKSVHYDYTATSYLAVLHRSIRIINVKNDSTIIDIPIYSDNDTDPKDVLIDARWQHNNNGIIAIAPNKIYIFGN